MERNRWFVVGTDFSPAADRALEHAAELAAELRVNVAVVHAYRDAPGDPLNSDPSPQLMVRLEDAASLLRMRHASLRVDCFVRRGAPWDKLVGVAHDLGAEMVIVGASGEHLPRNASFLGGVALRVAATSNRPVLVIPPRAAGHLGYVPA